LPRDEVARAINAEVKAGRGTRTWRCLLRCIKASASRRD
jgi:succinate dehydrogenase/fumarate reductase flavoprotein subunit